MAFAQDHDMVQALSPDRTDQPLCVPKIRFGVDAENGPRRIAA
jgi:hypothetical protein